MTDTPDSTSSTTASVSKPRGIWSSIGPAIITASVVLGPGSILSASKSGWQHGYQMTWVLMAAVLLMIGMTALSARLGVLLDGTICDELAKRAGRPIAALAGIAVFLIASCFQFGNNLGVLAAIEPFTSADSASILSGNIPIMIIVGLNVVIIVALFGFRALYQPVERLMKFLVALMMIGFAGNLLMARPDLLQALQGLMPSMPPGTAETILPKWKAAVVENGTVVTPGAVVDSLTPLIAMFATTFSVAGAFYQSYLVRQKGWTRKDLSQGLVDSAVGISVLGIITMMIMVTAAAVLHGNPDVKSLSSASDVARQLEPAFGSLAKVLFCMGIFAGAFSSFLVNAMIGGSMLSDGLGLGGYIDQRWPKIFTVLALMMGMSVAIWVYSSGERPVNLIVFAQSLTVPGVPILAGAMLWLATRSDMVGERKVPTWMKAVGFIALAIALFLSLRTAMTLLLPVING